MAVIENATYEEVVKVFGRPLEEMSDVGGAYTEEIDKLRELLPDALVTTYRWKHQVGMIERIDPSGTSTKYEYDSANRLISESYKTVGAETELLREYKYNLIGDNAD